MLQHATLTDRRDRSLDLRIFDLKIKSIKAIQSHPVCSRLAVRHHLVVTDKNSHHFLNTVFFRPQGVSCCSRYRLLSEV